MSDKRNTPRFGPLVIKASFASDTARGDGYLTNVSEGGAFLAVDSLPPIGTAIEIRAALPWRLGELRASARVRWQSSGDAETSGKIRGVGLAFEVMDPESRARLDSYLRKFAELAASIEEMREG